METFKLGSRYYYSRLSESTQFLYRAIYDEFAKGGSKVALSIPGSGFETEDGVSVSDLLSYVLDDNPHIFHLNTSQYHYSRYGDTVSVWLDPIYTEEEYKTLYAQLWQVVKRILSAPECSGSNEKKMWFLHSYLAATVEYDKEFKTCGDVRRSREAHSIVGALLRRKCVCDGYARAFRLLCDLACVSCFVMSGEAGDVGDMGPHAWNMVRTHGRTYHVDVTWDRKPETDPPQVLDDYFLRKDSLMQRSHAWTRRKFPECPDDSPVRPAVLKGRAQIEKYILDQRKKNKTRVVLHLDESFPGQDYLGELLSEMFRKYPDQMQRTRYSYVFNQQSLRGEVTFG